MQIMYGTSVLVAGSVASHPKHTIAFEWLKKARSNKIKMFVAAHSLAECYAVLTRLPLSPKILPETANYLIEENIKKISSIITLTSKEYMEVVDEMTQLNLAGGIIYDALIVKAALKSKVSKILTLNTKDFTLLTAKQPSFILSP